MELIGVLFLICSTFAGMFYIHCEHVKRVLFGPECNHKEHDEEEEEL